MMSNEESPEATGIVSLGKLTEFEPVDWVYPNIKTCPIDSCNMSFPNRNSALNHFRRQHADSTMKCMHCTALFSANDAQILFAHNQVQHLNKSSQKLKPICRNCLPRTSTMDKDKSSSDSDEMECEQQANDGYGSDNTNHDLKLGESTDFEAVVWHFPDTSQCPLKKCALSFSHRSVAALHFRIIHANTTMPCTICDELVSAEHAHDFLQHYRDMHPNERRPARKTQSVDAILVKDTPRSNVYCWVCAIGDINLRCTKCERRFHQECVANHVDSVHMCIECSKEDDFKPFDVSFIANILDFIKCDKEFIPLMAVRFTHKQTINTINIWGMQQKPYETIKQFEDDLKWFEYNCRSVLSQDKEIQVAIKALIIYVNEHIEIIRACGGCYQNAYEFSKGALVKQCQKLHLLLWAKVGGYSHWPAKVLAVNAEKRQVIVQFFGGYDWCILSVRHCYLFSNDNPEKKRGPRAKSYIKAMADVDEYIEHIRARFGDFNYEKSQTIFDPEKVDEYLERMIGERLNSACSASDTDSEYVPPNLESKYNLRFNTTRKRKVEVASCNGPRAKRCRSETDFGEISKSMEIEFAQGLRSLNQVNDNNVQLIGKLQRDLKTIENEKKALGQANDELIVDKITLEEAVKKLKEAQREAAKMFDDAKKGFAEKIAAWEKTRMNEKKRSDDEKKALERKIAALEANKNKNSCAHCRNYVDSLVFCNNDCVTKQYTNTQ